jgi:superfamily II DNA/RNA helicase
MSTIQRFQDFKLPAPILQALAALQFQKPTPIQEQAIPLALSGQDLIGSAQTGTGKTAAFCIPILVSLLKTTDRTALILAPTRELAQQTELFWKGLTRFAPEARSATLIGGVSMQPQIRALRNRPRLIIATPGRLLDHLGRKSASLVKTEMLILDEADRMLDMGFAPQLAQVLKYLPKTRQTMLFTATWSESMDRLAAQYLRQPARVSVGSPSKAAPKISQTAIQVTQKAKNEQLLDQLNATQGPVIVFARTQVRTDRVARYLESYGVKVNRIHGGRSQGQRKSALQAFKSGATRVLVATDIAARGIDVANIAHVINYDLPQQPEDYIHRIGRTARAGASGEATSFVTPDDRDQWRQILKLLKNTGSQLPRMSGAAAIS